MNIIDTSQIWFNGEFCMLGRQRQRTITFLVWNYQLYFIGLGVYSHYADGHGTVKT